MASAQYQGTGHTKQGQKFRVRTSIKSVRQCFLNAGFLKHAKVVPDHTGSEVTKIKSDVREWVIETLRLKRILRFKKKIVLSGL